MAVKITAHNPILIDFGDKHRIERRFKAEDDGSGFRWLVFELQQVKDSRHPVSGDPTTLKEIWIVKNVVKSEQEARSIATKLAGG